MKNIFFDLGGVLVNFSHEKMIQNIASYCTLDPQVVKAHLSDHGLAFQYERGEIKSQIIHEYFCQLSGKNLDFENLMTAASEIFSLKEEMMPILKELKKQNFRLFVLSNTCEAHFCYIQTHYEFLKFFDDFTLSYEVQSHKPEEKIYQCALQNASCTKDDCFYIDDILENVEAAIRFGIDSHHFQGISQLILDLEKRGINI